jgi:hypothetical protein
MTMHNWLSNVRRLAAHWRRDTRGTSMITTAITLPLLIIVFMTIWWLFLFTAVKQSLHHGVLDAAKYLSDEGRYWNIDPTLNASNGKADPVTGETLYVADYWDLQAKRVVANRLRDIILPVPYITTSLFVTVTEPLLAFSPEATAQPIESGQIELMCGNGPKFRKPGEFRDYRNIRFMVYATYKVPLWSVRIPYIKKPIDITLTDREIGYVQCPRWVGKTTELDPDKSLWLGREGPFLPIRNAWTPPPIPTVTARPSPTATPTITPIPSGTVGPTETPTDTPTPTETATPAPTNTSAPPP